MGARRLPDADELPLFAAARERDLADEPNAVLPVMSLGENIAIDYQTARLSLKGHPMGYLRAIFRGESILSCAELSAQRNGSRGRVAGVVLVRQRPGKGNAIFITLEDETGITNAVLWAHVRKIPQRSDGRAAAADRRQGAAQPENVVHLMAERIVDRTGELSRLSETNDFAVAVPLSPADAFISRKRRTLAIRVTSRSYPVQGLSLRARYRPA